MIFIKLPITCILLHSSVRMEIYIIIWRKNINSLNNKPRNILNKSWKEPNTCITMESFIEIWSQLTSSWKIVTAKLVILVLPKVYRMKTLLWSLLLALPSICHHKYLKEQNTQRNQIYGQLGWSIMKCFMEEHLGPLLMKWNCWMGFTLKKWLSGRK